MNRAEIKNRLTEIFQDVFDDDDIILTDNTCADDIEDWDSLEHINLIGAVERAFKMRFTVREVSGMKNVGEMMDILEERAK